MSREGRLEARPGAGGGAGRAGLHALGLDPARDSYLYVPDGGAGPAPLILMLHGAGGHAQHGIGVLRHLADETGAILLAPASRAPTWDVIAGGYGPDVEQIDRALGHVFGRHAVDPARVAIAGFSDGASYALSLGITNGDLFTHLLAFSPGFLNPGGQRGMPPIYISHGTGDRVLPIDRCSRRIAPALQSAGYRVLYREFEGGHTVPPEVAEEAVGWFVGGEGRGGE